MEIRTTKCSKFGQPEFVVRCDNSIPDVDVQWLISVLEGLARDKHVFRDGNLVQVGWILNRISATPDGGMRLSEPDMRTFPVAWTDGVTETLRQFRLQKDVADSLGFAGDMQIPTMNESAVAGIDLRQNDVAFVLDRVEATAGDSGWFVGCLGSAIDYSDASNLRRISLYEAALYCPGIVMFLSLPSGSRVERSGSSVSIGLHGEKIVPAHGSFLAQLLARN